MRSLLRLTRQSGWIMQAVGMVIYDFSFRIRDFGPKRRTWIGHEDAQKEFVPTGNLTETSSR